MYNKEVLDLALYKLTLLYILSIKFPQRKGIQILTKFQCLFVIQFFVHFQVRYRGESDAALITFATHSQATAAIKSSEPVLNNRFVKVFWHKKDDDNNDQSNAAAGDASSQVCICRNCFNVQDNWCRYIFRQLSHSPKLG